MIILAKGTAAYYKRSIGQMAGLRLETERLQQQLSTGNRIEASSDDPVAATRLRSLSRLDRLAAIDSENAARVGDGLRYADNALQNVANDLARARELTVQAANGTLSDTQRALIGEELDQIRTGILASANLKASDGRPLFAGDGAGPAYTLDAAGNTLYAGTAAAGDVSLSDGLSVTRGVTGPEAFAFTSDGTATDIFAFIKDLAEAIKGGSTDPAAAARSALGGFDDALESLTRSQTVIGVRVGWVETVQNRQVVMSEARAQETADTGGVDFASTVAELQQMLVVLEASQASFARVSQLSLFNAI